VGVLFGHRRGPEAAVALLDALGIQFRIRAVKRYYDTAWIRRIEARALRDRCS
jgi:hypothetical protein